MAGLNVGYAHSSPRNGERSLLLLGKAEILIDDENAILGPAEFACLAGKRILALRRFAIVLNLRGWRFLATGQSPRK